MSILNQNPLPFFINGQYVSPTGRQTFENINPVNGTLNFDVLESNADDVDHAVNSARSALAGPWADIDVDKRARLLHKVADLIDSRRDEFLAAEISDTGNRYNWPDISTFHAEQLISEYLPISSKASLTRRSVCRRPMGVKPSISPCASLKALLPLSAPGTYRFC